MKSFLAMTGAALLAFAQSPAEAAPAASASKIVSAGARFRDVLADLRRKYRVPGFSVAVYSSRGLRAAEVIGIRRMAQPAPLELSDRFSIGSVTKPITATLAASMVDAGLIAWTATPAEIWPSEASRIHPALREVTLAQLLSHRAGIQPFTDDKELAGVPVAAGAAREARAAFARRVLERGPASPVGAQKYSNGGFGIAAAMLEKVGGKSWEELVRERVFQPLSMSSCGFGWPSAMDDQPHGHRLVGGKYAEGDEGQTAGLPASIAPAGDVHCSMADLGRFGEAHLLGLLGRQPLLKLATFQAMHRPVEDYVLGWSNEAIGSSHRGGTTQGWHALLFVSPKVDIVVATAVNAREPGKTDELMQEITQLAFDLFGTRRSQSSK